MKKLFTLVLFLTMSQLSAEELQYGLINLDAQASTEVSNDELLAQLQVFEQGKDTGQLSNLVNKKTALVLDALKHFPAIQAKTTNYNTRPVYREGKIINWQVSQQVHLQSTNFEQMSQFLADINSLAQIQSMQFQVSQQQSDEVKDKLIKEAISQFQHKAKLVAEAFHQSHYNLVSLSVDGNHPMPIPMLERSNMMAAEMNAKSIPAALSAGTNEVSVTLRGTIQLSNTSE